MFVCLVFVCLLVCRLSLCCFFGVCLFVCLPSCRFACWHLCLCLSVPLPLSVALVCLCLPVPLVVVVCLYACRFVCVPVYLSVCLFIYLSGYLPTYIFVCLPVGLSVYPFLVCLPHCFFFFFFIIVHIFFNLIHLNILFLSGKDVLHYYPIQLSYTLPYAASLCNWPIVFMCNWYAYQPFNIAMHKCYNGISICDCHKS